MMPRRDLLRAQLDSDSRSAASLSGRIARWLSTDKLAQGRLRLELERCRLNHRHELSRLKTVLERKLLKAEEPHVLPESVPGDEPKIV